MRRLSPDMRPWKPVAGSLVALACAAAVAAVGTGVARGEKAKPSPAARPAAAADGVIRGTVRFTGKPPARPALDRSTDPVCARTPRLAEDVVVTDGGLRDVLVRLKVGTAGSHPAPTTPVVVEQQQCMYTPRVVAVMPGQKLVVRNGDATFHNVRGALGARNLWNLAQPAQAPEIVRDQLGKPGEIVALHCDVHPWMQAWAVVVDHPFVAVTGADGAFELRGVPAGTYEVEAWHPTLGLQTAKVTVGSSGAKATAAAAFSFKSPSPKPSPKP